MTCFHLGLSEYLPGRAELLIIKRIINLYTLYHSVEVDETNAYVNILYINVNMLFHPIALYKIIISECKLKICFEEFDAKENVS